MMNYWWIFGMVVCLIALFFAWVMCRISAMADERFAGDDFLSKVKEGEK